MSAKGKAGKAAWQERGSSFRDDLQGEIAHRAEAQMQGWSRRGRVPARVRVMARLEGHPLRLEREPRP